ncbi:MAG TPA: ABC transporter substrate-binding protein [Pilimelia sp.]|nr:ABC transporter substrate-binding protein [Pilimelia sp.]
MGGMGLLAAAGLPACAGGREHRSRPAATVTVLTGFGLLGQDSYLFLGRQLGFFAEAGIDLKVVPGAGTEKNLVALAAGQADVAVVDLTGAIIARGRGNTDVTTIGVIYQRSVSTITALDGSGVRVPKDLAGRRIGYQPGGVNHTLFPAYARIAGVDTRGIRWVPSPPPQLRALLANNTVDAITETVIGTPGVQAAAKGRTAMVLPYSDHLADLYGNVYVTGTRTAAQRTDLIRRFRQAALRALHHAMDHPDQAGQAFHQAQPHYPAHVAAAETRLMVPYVRAGTPADTGRIDPGRVARSIAVVQGVGAVPPGIEPPHVVHFDLANPDGDR